jgi:hypothetical protein
VQDGGCRVLPISTKICGDGNGKDLFDTSGDPSLRAFRNSFTSAVVVVTSSHDTRRHDILILALLLGLACGVWEDLHTLEFRKIDT